MRLVVRYIVATLAILSLFPLVAGVFIIIDCVISAPFTTNYKSYDLKVTNTFYQRGSKGSKRLYGSGFTIVDSIFVAKVNLSNLQDDNIQKGRILSRPIQKDRILSHLIENDSIVSIWTDEDGKPADIRAKDNLGFEWAKTYLESLLIAIVLIMPLVFLNYLGKYIVKKLPLDTDSSNSE